MIMNGELELGKEAVIADDKVQSWQLPRRNREYYSVKMVSLRDQTCYY
jgi:hypothetical protein